MALRTMMECLNDNGERVREVGSWEHGAEDLKYSVQLENKKAVWRNSGVDLADLSSAGS